MPQHMQQICLARRPEGVPVSADFALRETEIGTPKEDEVLLKHLYLSLDPAIRGWMNDAKSYLPPIALGAPVRSGTLSQIVKSTDPNWPEGSLVQALAAWEEYSVVSTHMLHGHVQPIQGVPLSAMLSVLGGNGLTAYFGLLDVGRPKEGETVLVSAAAGGVGSIVGQIAKIHGCRVVGITGREEKARWLLNELHYDAAINYQNQNLYRAIRDTCPQGVDIFFDGVGGEMLNTVLTRLNLRGRVVVCGAISQINASELPPGPCNYIQLIAKRARMEGFVTLDYADRFEEARATMATWIQKDRLRFCDEIIEGIVHTPTHLMRLFTGDHRGKLMVKLADPA